MLTAFAGYKFYRTVKDDTRKDEEDAYYRRRRIQREEEEEEARLASYKSQRIRETLIPAPVGLKSNSK
jgi:hypothetical protein